MGGEGGPAHAGQARVAHGRKDLFRSEISPARPLVADPGRPAALAVVDDLHGRHLHADRVEGRDEPFHLAGDGRMDRGRDESAGLTDPLACQDLVPLVHTGPGGRAEVLHEGHHENLGCIEDLDGPLLSALLELGRVNPAVKGPSQDRLLNKN